MTAAAPWSVKGIDPKAREVAKELARRSGMTLGEWLNRVILEDDLPEDVTSEEHFSARPHRAVIETPKSYMPSTPFTSRPDELGRIAFALDRLTDRIEASETRTGLAISGVEHSVRHAMARIETAEREHMAVATRFDAAAERLEAEQARAAERLRRMEEETSGPRSAEALRMLEERLTRAESLTGSDPSAMIDEVVARLAQRLADAESRTGDALESLRGSLAEMDERLHLGARRDIDHRLEGLADQLTRSVEDARNEIAQRLAATGSGQMEARLGQMAEEVAAVEQRSARAIETMGREVLTMAETLSRRVQSAEQRSAQAIEQVGGEIARIAGAVENRLGRTDQLHAEALERLGSEIGRITERLTDRIIQSERRAAQAIDDVGEQVAKVTERIEQRHERAASDLAERIRQSEERTARLLDDARLRLGGGPAEPAEMAEATPEAEPESEPAPVAAETEFSPASMVFGPELFSRAEPLSQPALDPGNPAFGEEDFEAADGFVPIAESDHDHDHHDHGHDAAGHDHEDDRLDLDAPPIGGDRAPLSTREVIEQARAAARAAAAAPRPKTLHAGERRPLPARGGLFGALKPGRPASTWQTALMVAGGAAFLSVGAAGVVLMEGPGAPLEVANAQPFPADPRAAIALAPQSLTAIPTAPRAPAAIPAAAPSPDTVTADYLATARAVEAKQPGALSHLKAIAETGHAPAQVFLARLYETGQAGVVQNFAEARRWTARAADGGDPSAMHNLALYYFRGEGGPADTAAAAQWFKKAAQHGVVDSQYNLGLLYQSGSGVPRDLAQAYKWFSIAANAGDAEARASAVEVEAKLPTAQLAQAQAQVNAFEPAGAAPTTENLAYGPSVVAAQKILGRLGYFKGAPDGSASRALKLAVAAYQRDQGLAATGSLDPATVSRLSVFTR